jgi:hypothetical protein
MIGIPMFDWLTRFRARRGSRRLVRLAKDGRVDDLVRILNRYSVWVFAGVPAEVARFPDLPSAEVIRAVNQLVETIHVSKQFDPYVYLDDEGRRLPIFSSWEFAQQFSDLRRGVEPLFPAQTILTEFRVTPSVADMCDVLELDPGSDHVTHVPAMMLRKQS